MKLAVAPKSHKYALALAVIIVVAIWWTGRDVRAGWYGVPPVPSATGLSFSGLGDLQFAYRMTGLTLQTLGDEGGRVTPLTDYDYAELEKWFYTLYRLDPRSDFVPMLAAFYFGASQDPEDTIYVINFLEDAGDDTYKEKWRWLVHAVYLARYREKDIEHALEIAKTLADLGLKKDDIPVWTLHMAPFILADMGEEEASRELLKVILGSAQNLNPNEINFMINYIESRSAE